MVWPITGRSHAFRLTHLTDGAFASQRMGFRHNISKTHNLLYQRCGKQLPHRQLHGSCRQKSAEKGHLLPANLNLLQLALMGCRPGYCDLKLAPRAYALGYVLFAAPGYRAPRTRVRACGAGASGIQPSLRDSVSRLILLEGPKHRARTGQ